MQASALLSTLAGLVIAVPAAWWCYSDPIVMADITTTIYTLLKCALLLAGGGTIVVSVAEFLGFFD